MDDSYVKILNILKKVRKRVFLKITVKNSIAGICLALAIGVIMGLLSRVVPVYNVYSLWTYIAAVILVLALFSAFLFLPKQKEMAQLLDSFGLQERITTSLELETEASVYKEFLLKDTVNHLEKLDYKEKISMSPNKNIIITLIVLLIAFGATLLMPEPLKEEAQKAHELSVYKKEHQKKVGKSEKEIEKNAALTEEQKKDLLSKLEVLKQELKKAENPTELQKALEKTAKKLEQKIDASKAADLKSMAERLAENKETKALANALKSGNMDEVAKQLEKLKNKAQSMDSSSRKSLEDTMAKASNAVGDSELKDGLDSLSNALNDGDENSINKSVDKISGAVKNGLSQEKMNEALAKTQSNLQAQQPGDAQAQGQGQGQGTGQSAGQGAGGSGAGNGNGAGSGAGGGGSGAGSGSGNNDAGVTPYGQGGIANKTPSGGTEKQYEKVFTPTRLGGQGETSLLTGKNNNNPGNGESKISDNTNATLGELKPYNQVVGEYSEKAMESVNNSSIPSGMEDIIKSYFSSLQE